MEKTDFDLVIIGGGPAGLTAGIYASRARLNTIMFEKAAKGGQIIITDWVENYPGFPEGISGYDLGQKMTEQAEQFGLKTEFNEVTGLDLSGAVKKIMLADKEINASSIIIAAGSSPQKLGIPGEAQMFGKGVSSCATCDGPMLRDKVVAVVGGGNTAVQESIYLTKFVEKVFLIHRRDELRATKILQERAFENDKIEIVWDTVVTSIEGLFGVEKIVVKNVKTDEISDIPVDGCFVLIGYVPNTDFLGDAVAMDEKRFVLADSNMATNVPGVFAAGDVRNTPLRQVATAVGDGAIAAFSAGHYLENL